MTAEDFRVRLVQLIAETNARVHCDVEVETGRDWCFYSAREFECNCRLAAEAVVEALNIEPWGADADLCALGFQPPPLFTIGALESDV